MQTGHAATVRATVLAPLEATAQAARAQRAARAATTKVDFFTMVRGED
jgi:alpha-D-ribose 1-methylphosphonate 5-triphosphate synthase subunit PhnG